MDRDAPPPPATPADALPPYAPDLVRVTGLAGIGLNAAAAVLGVVAAMSSPPPEALTVAQVLLVFIGTVTAGAALSMRSDLWWAWGLFGIAGLAGWAGLPASWDSFPPFFRALAGVGAGGAIVCLIPFGWRVAVATVVVAFHFGGIFASTTSPPPQPWIVEQARTRAFLPYLTFMYMGNAYHFYSPNPGPASLLAFFLKTETGTDANGAKTYDTRWVVLPTRPDDLRDPLGLGYFRRLSLTEQVVRGGGGLSDQSEKAETIGRRHAVVGTIPLHPLYPMEAQYRLPGSEVVRYVLPSYASHIILDETPDAATAAKTTVKIYRLEHQTTPVEQFRQKLPNGDYPSPYHPGTYRPYFLGEFDAHGNLLDPQDKLLYWMVPIVPQPLVASSPDAKGFYDYLSVHALGWTLDAVDKAKEEDGMVFPWKKLQPRR